MLTEAKEAIEVGIPIAQGVHNILKERGVYQKVIDFFTGNKKQHILLLGASGSGKSSLFHTVQGLPAYIPREHRTDDSRSIDGMIDRASLTFIDTPGDDRHEARRIETIRNSQQTDRLGIINVVSYGYHEGLAQLSDAVEGDKARENFLEARRKVELGRLTEWTSILCGRGGNASWVITVVTKADLWWQNTDDQPVMAYYQSGGYSDALGEAREQPCSVRAYSSLNQLFYGHGKMTGYYTDHLRQNHHAGLISLILERCADAR